MDRNRLWMYESKGSNVYHAGVLEFLNFAFSNVEEGGVMWCPCRKCVNRCKQSRMDMHFHLLKYGILKNYNVWVYQGEVEHIEKSAGQRQTQEGSSNIEGIERAEDTCDGPDIDMFQLHNDLLFAEDQNINVEVTTRGNSDANYFLKKLEEAEAPLYPGSENYSWMAFVLELFHLKCLYGGSTAYFDAQLQLLKKAFPKENNLPESTWAVMVKIKELGLGYDKIDACENNCILYRGPYKDRDDCPTCGKSRWKMPKNLDDEPVIKRKKIPVKVLRYFPIIPRLKRLYMTKEVAKCMRWHHEERIEDGFMRILLILMHGKS